MFHDYYETRGYIVKKRITAFVLCLIIAFSSMLTLSACKPKTFTVTFNRGGTADMNITVMEGYEDIPEIQTVTSWRDIVFPVYICDKYTLSGWSEVISRIDKDTVITAVWTPNPFLVKFDPVNTEAKFISGELEQTVHNWTEIIFPQYDLPGYHLKWEYDVRKTEDTTVKATWLPNDYQLSFIDENGESFGFENLTVLYEQPVLNLPTPEKEGKRFGAWRLVDNIARYIHEGSTWDRAENATLQARWLDADEFRITYKNAYDVKGEIAYRSTDQTFVINPPERYGYDFVGWTGTGIGDQPQLEVVVASGSNYDIELTAHWKVKERTLSLDADGGQLSQTGKAVTFGKPIGELPSEVTKEGYEFIGWQTSNGTMVDENTIWTWDPDNVNSLKAVYLRLYTVKLILRCTAPNVIATLSDDAISKYGLIKSETENNVWIFEKTFKEGERLGDLPTKDYVKLSDRDSDEYRFSHWAINKTGVKVTSADIVNEKKFPGSREGGVIELSIKLSTTWTPFY